MNKKNNINSIKQQTKTHAAVDLFNSVLLSHILALTPAFHNDRKKSNEENARDEDTEGHEEGCDVQFDMAPGSWCASKGG